MTAWGKRVWGKGGGDAGCGSVGLRCGDWDCGWEKTCGDEGGSGGAEDGKANLAGSSTV